MPPEPSAREKPKEPASKQIKNETTTVRPTASGGGRTYRRTHMVHPRRRTGGGKGKGVGEGGVARQADEVTGAGPESSR